MRTRILLLAATVISVSSCREVRIHEHPEWEKVYEKYGIKDACIMIEDNNHESVEYYNKERCRTQYTPASTFKIVGSLIGLESGEAPDESYVIPWDSVSRRDTCNRNMSMREAFKVSCYGYFKGIADRVGREEFQHYIDTLNYGNKELGKEYDAAWVNGTLMISADEQVGLVKRLYHGKLPFQERSQRIVRSMMLWEETPGYRLSYKTGTGEIGDKYIYWIVGYVERIEHMKEHEKSMNKADHRYYPYFFAQNFEAPKSDTTHDYFTLRVAALKEVLREYGAIE
ncbi:MAG: class D beta-lactamase [Flavipsychrobacter sp.]|nr:class D beta-lactamase [Flavipsychrobacter sp.]